MAERKVNETERESSAAEDLPYFKAAFPHRVDRLTHCSQCSVREQEAEE